MSGRCVVMRSPVLQEDEGRSSYIRSFDSAEAAKAWVRAQKGQYFGPSDYYIMMPTEDGGINYTVTPE